jgi:hypothetical protein
MDSERKQALQVAKEVVIKFIEVGRISPANFAENFALIHDEVLRVITKARESSSHEEPHA